MDTLGCLLDLLPNPLVDFLLRLVLLPVVLILATPVVMVQAAYGSGEYFQNVRSRYQSIIDYWVAL